MIPSPARMGAASACAASERGAPLPLRHPAPRDAAGEPCPRRERGAGHLLLAAPDGPSGVLAPHAQAAQALLEAALRAGPQHAALPPERLADRLHAGPERLILRARFRQGASHPLLGEGVTLGALALGNVAEQPGDAGHPVVLVEDEPRAHLHPAHRPVPGQVAVLVLAALDLAPHEGREALEVGVTIVGMHERREGLADALGHREAGEL